MRKYLSEMVIKACASVTSSKGATCAKCGNPLYYTTGTDEKGTWVEAEPYCRKCHG